MQNVLKLASFTVMAQAVGILALPLLTRLYTPTDFGVLAVFAAIIAILVMGVTLRYDQALILPKQAETGFALLVGAGLSTCVLSAVVGGIIWLWGAQLVEIFNVPNLLPWLGLVPLSLLFMGLYNIGVGWCMRVDMYTPLARSQISRTLGMAGAQVGLGVTGFGVGGLLIGQAVGFCVGFSLFWRQFKTSWNQLWASLTWAQVWQQMKIYRRFPTWSAPSSMLETANAVQLPLLLTTALYGVVAGGHMLLAVKLLIVPILLVGSTVGKVYQGAFRARLTADGSEIQSEMQSMDMAKLYQTWLIRLGILGGAGYGLGAFMAPFLVVPLFGAAWAPAVGYLQILALLYVGELVAQPLGPTLDLLQRQRLKFGFSMLRLGVTLCSFVGLHALGADMVSVLWVFASTQLLVHVVEVGVCMRLLKRLRRFESV